MIKASDRVMDFLARKGVEDVFTLTGGGIMHLVDSLGRHPSLRYWCNHHEQACAIAAESYARRRGSVGVCLVTTGPGGTNALSAIPGAFVDSIPMLVISGQVRRDLIADYRRLRQLGPQEVNIVEMARPVVKHVVQIRESRTLDRELEKAWRIATSGRPGPVWVDIPLDVQGAMVEVSDFEAPETLPLPGSAPRPSGLGAIPELLAAARRPIWVFGQGIRQGGAQAAMRRAVEAYGFPALFTIGGMDLLEDAHPLNQGRFGPVGQRRANFALQNSDLVLAVGASLSVASIGFNTASVAPGARKVLVNIDPAELDKPNLSLDASLAMDAGAFLEALQRELPPERIALDGRWLGACRRWTEHYPTLGPEYLQGSDYVNTYAFAAELSELLEPGDTVVTGNSLDIVSIYHSFRVKPGQRVYTNINYGAMGWDLPAAVGASVALGRGRVVLVTGDGSLQLNIQELLTVKQYGLDLKLFVVNNEGYEAIRSTQRTFFGGRFVGSDPSSGVGNPDYRHLAAAYGLGYRLIRNHEGMREALRDFLAEPGPGLCELHVDPLQPRMPKATAIQRPDGSFESRPLHDMAPFLPPEEVEANMALLGGSGA